MAAMVVDAGGGGGNGGTTLSEMYQSSMKLLMRVRDGVERLERQEYNSAAVSSSSSSYAGAPSFSMMESSLDNLFNSVKKDLGQIQSLCSEMDRLWRSIPSKPQRDLWKRKVEKVAEEADSLKASLDNFFARHQKRLQEAQERAELLGRANGESSHILRIFDDEVRAVESVRSSSRMLEEAYSTGVAILSKYSEQRDHLKRAQRKALDVLNTLGLSNSVLRLIERRNRVDRWIKYGGMILTIIIVIYVWRWR